MYVDLFGRMLDGAKKLISAIYRTTSNVFEEDAAQLPSSEQSFEELICTFAHNVIPDYMQLQKKIEKILIPGGPFAGLEYRTWQGETQLQWFMLFQFAG